MLSRFGVKPPHSDTFFTWVWTSRPYLPKFGVLFRLGLQDQELQQRYRYDLDQEKAAASQGMMVVVVDGGCGEQYENEGWQIWWMTHTMGFYKDALTEASWINCYIVKPDCH